MGRLLAGEPTGKSPVGGPRAAGGKSAGRAIAPAQELRFDRERRRVARRRNGGRMAAAFSALRQAVVSGLAHPAISCGLQAKQRVDLVLRGVTDLARELRAVEQPGVALARRRSSRPAISLKASSPPQISIMRTMCVSMNFSVPTTLVMRWPVRSWKLHASKILITRSCMSCDQRLVLLVLQARRQRVRHLVDLLGAREDLLGRVLGAADDRVELVGDARHLRPFEAGDVHASRFPAWSC